MGSIDAHQVVSAGLRLAVREHSRWAVGKQSLILVHGYPDQQEVWDRVIACLPTDEFHIVTYDVRGAGASGVPEHQSGYQTEFLIEDLIAVTEAVVPDGSHFHLVGHDWGSVQLWEVVHAATTRAQLRGRIASFTSISGPSLDHLAYLARHRTGRHRKLLKQAAHSWYVAAFQVPVVPELFWRFGHRAIAGRMASAEGRNSAHRGSELRRNAINGLGLYRANIGSGSRRPGTLRTDVPVLVVRPLSDPFISEVVYDDVDVACSDVSIVDLDAGHWCIRTHPEQVAELVTQHVRRNAGNTLSIRRQEPPVLDA